MKSRLLLLLAVLLSTNTALAKEYKQDPFNDNDFTEKPTLLDKANPTQKRLEIGIDFTTSMVEKYTEHNGIIATLGWHFHDTFALELYGGYMFGDYTNLLTQVADKKTKSNPVPNLPNREVMTWVADAVMLWTPIYGKINLVSELAISGNIYFLLGAGANGYKEGYAAHLADASGQFRKTAVYNDSGVKFNFQWGVGGRLYLTKWMAIRLEYRDIDYVGTWKSTKATNTTADYKYVTMNHMFHVGLSFFPF